MPLNDSTIQVLEGVNVPVMVEDEYGRSMPLSALSPTYSGVPQVAPTLGALPEWLPPVLILGALFWFSRRR